jgi:SAM-dependent methyltransferase
MVASYDPKRYWEARLSKSFSLKGVGHIGFSDRYNRWLYHRKDKCLTAALSATDLRGTRVLDVGCGTGFFVQWYRARGADVSGIDITNVSIERLKQRFGDQFSVQDISDPAYQPSQLFDIVNMWDVMYHIVAPDAFERALSNLARSLKPGGLLLLTDWFGAADDVRVADHVQGRCLQTYKARLIPKGFHLVGINSLYHLLNRPHLRRVDNYLGWLYYALDNKRTDVATDNISLGVWQLGSTPSSVDRPVP